MRGVSFGATARYRGQQVMITSNIVLIAWLILMGVGIPLTAWLYATARISDDAARVIGITILFPPVGCLIMGIVGIDTLYLKLEASRKKNIQLRDQQPDRLTAQILAELDAELSADSFDRIS